MYAYFTSVMLISQVPSRLEGLYCVFHEVFAYLSLHFTKRVNFGRPMSDDQQLFAALITSLDYIASYVSGQDEPNPALWLAPWAAKMELSCLTRTTHCVQQENFPNAK